MSRHETTNNLHMQKQNTCEADQRFCFCEADQRFCTARFVSNLFGNRIVGFLMMRLKSYWYNCILLEPLTLSIINQINDSSVHSSNVYNNQFITVKAAPGLSLKEKSGTGKMFKGQ